MFFSSPPKLLLWHNMLSESNAFAASSECSIACLHLTSLPRDDVWRKIRLEGRKWFSYWESSLTSSHYDDDDATLIDPIKKPTRVFNRVPNILVHKVEKMQETDGKNGFPKMACSREERNQIMLVCIVTTSSKYNFATFFRFVEVLAYSWPLIYSVTPRLICFFVLLECIHP